MFYFPNCPISCSVRALGAAAVGGVRRGGGAIRMGIIIRARIKRALFYSLTQFCNAVVARRSRIASHSNMKVISDVALFTPVLNHSHYSVEEMLASKFSLNKHRISNHLLQFVFRFFGPFAKLNDDYTLQFKIETFPVLLA